MEVVRLEDATRAGDADTVYIDNAGMSKKVYVGCYPAAMVPARENQ